MQLSPARRERLVQIYQTVMDKVRDEINEWPEVALRVLEARRIQNSQNLTLTLNLEPHAVALVVLRGNIGQ